MPREEKEGRAPRAQSVGRPETPKGEQPRPAPPDHKDMTGNVRISKKTAQSDKGQKKEEQGGRAERIGM